MTVSRELGNVLPRIPGPDDTSASIRDLRVKWRNQAITRFDRWSMSVMAMFRQPSQEHRLVSL
jgi:hypothetical protein